MKRFLLLPVLAFSGYAAEIPDIFLDYVLNNGTQYFDTGVIGKSYTKVEIDFLAESFPTHGKYIFGSRSSSFKFAPWYYNYGIGLYYNDRLINSHKYASASTRYSVRNVLEPGLQTVDWLNAAGESVKQYTTYNNDNRPPSQVNVNTGLPMFLFAANDEGTPDICDGKIRLYGLKVWQKDSADAEYVLVRDYKPANNDGKVCLYDDVEKTIIYPKSADGGDGTIVGSPSYVNVYATDYNGMTPIEQLTNAVATATRGTVIQLEKGVYKFPDDVFMADNTRNPSSVSYCKIRLNVTQEDIILRGMDTSNRRSWTHGAEPVIIDGNGGKALQIQLNKNGSMRIENITFVNCDGGAYGNGSSSEDSLYGNWCNGGAIGIGKMANPWKGGDNVVISNCVFRNNRSAIGGAIGSKNNYFVRDCFFTNNVSDSLSGSMYYGSAYGCDFIGNCSPGSTLSQVDDCRFVSNYSRQDVAILAASTVSNCVFIANISSNWAPIASGNIFANCCFTNNPSTIYGTLRAKGGTVTNCIFHGNVTGNQSYGSVSDVSLMIDCRLTSNGGYSGGGLTIVSTNWRCRVKNCYFGGNNVSVGGAGARLSLDLNEYPTEELSEPLVTFESCMFETNYVHSNSGQNGGAIVNEAKNIPEGVALESLIACTNCSFIANKAMHASGVKGVTAIDCIFDNIGNAGFNFLGNDAAFSRLVNCEIKGGNLYKCSIDRSHVNSVTNFGVFNIGCYVTNTLVTGCTLMHESGGIVARYYGTTAGPASEFVNCTFTGNKGNFFGNTNYVTSINCAYFSNTNRAGTASAISFNDAACNDGHIVFENCAFGALASDVGELHGSNNMTDLDPRFAAGRKNYENEPYYSPALSSPLRGRGLTLGYGTDDLDLSGRPRIRDGKVDIGCYQCWAISEGWMMIVR